VQSLHSSDRESEARVLALPNDATGLFPPRPRVVATRGPPHSGPITAIGRRLISSKLPNAPSSVMLIGRQGAAIGVVKGLGVFEDAESTQRLFDVLRIAIVRVVSFVVRGRDL
jgi:hypothetical protein